MVLVATVAAIYIVKTELEALASEIVAHHFQGGGYNALYHLGDSAPVLRKRGVFNTVASLQFLRASGLLGKQKAIRKALMPLVEALKELDGGVSEILIHLPKLSATRSNFAINFLRFHFPGVPVRARLIPHGTVNFSLQRITWGKKLTLWRRWAVPFNFVFPDLRYYIPRGDWVGGFDPLVDRIYVLPGTTHPYPDAKVVPLPSLADYLSTDGDACQPLKTVALVIGQPALRVGAIDQVGHDRITLAIKEWLVAQGITETYYSRHPRAREHLDFFDKSYRVLDQDGALESLLPSIGAGIVVSCFSTALFTSHMLLGNGARVVSIGMNLADFSEKAELLESMRACGIEIVDV